MSDKPILILTSETRDNPVARIWPETTEPGPARAGAMLDRIEHPYVYGPLTPDVAGDTEPGPHDPPTPRVNVNLLQRLLGPLRRNEGAH